MKIETLFYINFIKEVHSIKEVKMLADEDKNDRKIAV